jgi:L-serine dehydratase
MEYISIFDIIGPVMIGPSSSHTAGAVRLGNLARKILGENPNKVSFTLYNSYAKTGKGHGTDKGLLAGILGLNVDDSRIKFAYEIAKENDLEYKFFYKNSSSRHPNSVDIEFHTPSNITISGDSLGAGEVKITSINGFNVDLRGHLSTLLIVYKDIPGMIWRVTKLLQEKNINIASLKCDRNAKGADASMSICVDETLSNDIIEHLKKLPDVYMVRSIEALEK